MNAEKWDWKRDKPPDSVVTSSGSGTAHRSTMQHSGHTSSLNSIPHELSTKESTSVGNIFLSTHF